MLLIGKTEGQSVKALQAVAFAAVNGAIYEKKLTNADSIHKEAAVAFVTQLHILMYACGLYTDEYCKHQLPAYHKMLLPDLKDDPNSLLFRYSKALGRSELKDVEKVTYLKLSSTTAKCDSTFTGNTIWDRSQRQKAPLMVYMSLWASYVKDDGDFYSGDNEDSVLEKVLRKLHWDDTHPGEAPPQLTGQLTGASAAAADEVDVAEDQLDVASLRNLLKTRDYPAIEPAENWSPGPLWAVFKVFGPWIRKFGLDPLPYFAENLDAHSDTAKGTSRKDQRNEDRKQKVEERVNAALQGKETRAQLELDLRERKLKVQEADLRADKQREDREDARFLLELLKAAVQDAETEEEKEQARKDLKDYMAKLRAGRLQAANAVSAAPAHEQTPVANTPSPSAAGNAAISPVSPAAGLAVMSTHTTPSAPPAKRARGAGSVRGRGMHGQPK